MPALNEKPIPRGGHLTEESYLREQYELERIGRRSHQPPTREEFYRATAPARQETPKMNQTIEQLEALAEHLGLELETLERISQAGPEYFETAREEVLKALRNWDADQKIPVCLYCGSPKVDWIEATASYRCQECGAEEERAGEGRKAA